MSIKISCLQCGASHKVNDRLAGKRVRCPQCETVVHVPEADTPVAVEPEVVAVDPVDKATEPIAAAEVESVPVEAVPVEAAPIESVPAEVAAEAAAVVAAEPVAVEAVSGEPAAVEAAPVAAAGGDDSGTSATTDVSASGGGGDSTVDDDDLDRDDEAMPPRKKRDDGELDMTPMVDVTFLLLIFFVVTASFQLQKSIMMPKQKTDAPSTNAEVEDPEELDQVELQIDEFGGFLVLASDWEAETPGKQNLISKLKEAQGDVDTKLVIKVHEQCKLQSLVDGMDAGSIAGYKEVEVTQVDQFD